jgi:hypothetical protein
MSADVNLELEYIRKSQTIREIEMEFNLNIFENRFFKNKDYLIDNADLIAMQSTWNLNSQQFCLDHYKVYELYPIVLLVNNLNSMFEFKAENIVNKIIAPTTFAIYNLLF